MFLSTMQNEWAVSVYRWLGSLNFRPRVKSCILERLNLCSLSLSLPQSSDFPLIRSPHEIDSGKLDRATEPPAHKFAQRGFQIWRLCTRIGGLKCSKIVDKQSRIGKQRWEEGAKNPKTLWTFPVEDPSSLRRRQDHTEQVPPAVAWHGSGSGGIAISDA